MSRTIDDTIRALFRGDGGRMGYFRQGDTNNSHIKYMTIPINKDTFEIPTFCFDTFKILVDNNQDTETDAIIVQLNTRNSESDYKSLDRVLRDVLQSPFISTRLLTIKVKKGNEDIIYYGTNGAIFNTDFKPLAICSFLMERYTTEEGITKYRFLRHVLRVNPDVFISKADPMERFIANKMITICLDRQYRFPHRYLLSDRVDYNSALKNVKVEIDDCPFSILEADVPSISTTNQQLTQIVLDHLDEALQ
jgi:hypothetical protein